MKIAIVHDFLIKMGGAEKVLLALLELYPKADVFTLLYDKKGTNKIFDNYNVLPSKLQKLPGIIRKPKFLLAKFPLSIEEFDFSDYDLVISSSNSFAHGIITSPKTFHLTYCHSPMRYAWDWYFEYLSEKNINTGIIGLYIRNILHKIRIWDKVASARTDCWVSNSNYIGRRIKKYYRKDSETIYPPCDTEKITPASNIPDNYYVILSRLEPYKKIDLAINAFNKLNKNLVVIGTGSDFYNLKKIANKNIEFLGWQSDQSVYEYIRNAKALIFPGEEDFGIVPVEAMACGRPVIAYGKGGALETIIPNKTGLFFKDQKPESLIEAINKLEKDYLQYSIKNCVDQANKFTKEIFKMKIQSLIRKEYDNYMKKYDKNS